MTQTHIFSLVAHIATHQRTCVGSRPSGRGHVDCLSPRAHQKVTRSFQFRGTVLESQFYSPQSVLIILLYHHLLHGRHSRHSARIPLWPNIRTDPSHRFMSPNLSSKSAVSTRRSIVLLERTASTQTSTISQPRWLHLKSLIR